MGLSIRYALATTVSDTEAVRKLVEEMRRLALGLSFERMGPVVEVVRPHQAGLSCRGRSERRRRVLGVA